MTHSSYYLPVLSGTAGLVAVVAAVAAGDRPAPGGIPGVGPVGPITKVQGGFGFTEGPAADGLGNLYFSDIPNNRIHKLDAAGKVTVFREPSNHANGLMVNAKGEVVACEMDGQVVALSPDGKERRVVAGQYNGKRFNAPNDLVLDRSGGVYFTDPSFRAPNPRPQDKLAVYYVDPAGTVTRLIDDLPNPNGVILSPDEQTLYVIPSGQAEMMAYPVQSPGKVGPGRVFCRVTQPPGQTKAGGDGCAVDTRGDVYIATALGVEVFDTSGKSLGVIKFPEQPANLDFGGPDLKTLYVTARTSLYSARMESSGHRFAGGSR
jgi:gluconolactonase